MTNHVPKAALANLEHAEALHKQAYEAPQDTPPKEEAPQDTGKPVANEEGKPTETPAPEIAIGHADDHDAFTEENFRRLQSAHKTLQGKYRAEVPRLQERIRELEGELKSKSRDAADAQQQAQSANKELEALQARLQEELGAEASSVVGEYTSKAINEALNKRQEDEAQAKAAAAEQKQKTKAETFWNEVYAKVPTFNDINNSPDFVAWLHSNNDPITGMTLHYTLNQAGKALNSSDVISIFERFAKAKSARDAAPSPEDHITPNQQAPSQEVHQPRYTMNDWHALQEQRRKGEWAGREAEADALEQKIHAALLQAQ